MSLSLRRCHRAAARRTHALDADRLRPMFWSANCMGAPGCPAPPCRSRARASAATTSPARRARHERAERRPPSARATSPPDHARSAEIEPGSRGGPSNGRSSEPGGDLLARQLDQAAPDRWSATATKRILPPRDFLSPRMASASAGRVELGRQLVGSPARSSRVADALHHRPRRRLPAPATRAPPPPCRWRPPRRAGSAR